MFELFAYFLNKRIPHFSPIFSPLCQYTPKSAVRFFANCRFIRVSVVEVTGFEPATFWSRTKRATKLRYTSTGKREWSQ